MLMHLEVYRQRPDVQAVVHAHPPIATGFAVAGIPLDRAGPGRSADDARQHSDCGVRDAVDRRSCPEAVRKYIKAHDGMLLANHGALTVGGDLFAAYFKMETIEHFAKISLVARLLGRENLIAREEVLRLQDLRGTHGIKAPAPICADPADGAGCADRAARGDDRGDDDRDLSGGSGARRRRDAPRARSAGARANRSAAQAMRKRKFG